MQNGLTELEQRRLAWRCRRGLLELDIVLQRFVLKHVNSLSVAEMQAFDALLELPDNEFWNKLHNKNIVANNVEQQAVLDVQQAVLNKLNNQT